ncbi:O-antigen ligase family protein [bacterium]|nr:O-antigen ligase family protein [bacterium]
MRRSTLRNYECCAGGDLSPAPYLLWESAAMLRAGRRGGTAKVAGILLAAGLAQVASQPAARQALRHHLPAALALVVSAVAVYGLVRHFASQDAARATIEAQNLVPEMRRRMLHALQQHRLSVLFGNSNQLAALFVLSLPFFVVLVRRARAAGRAGWTLLAIVVLAALLCTKSRGGLLAAGATAVLLAWRGDFGFRLSRGSKSGFAVIVLILLCTVVALGGKRLRDVETIRARGEYWQAAAQMIAARPLVGHGIEGYRFHFPAYRVPGGVEARQPHNWPLEAAVEGGVLPALWSFALLLWLACLALRNCGDPVMAACRIAAAVFALQCLWDFHNNVTWLLALFAALWALAEPPGRLSRRTTWGLAVLTIACSAALGAGAAGWVGPARAWVLAVALVLVVAGMLVGRRVGWMVAAGALFIFAWSVVYQGSLSKVDEDHGVAAWRGGDATTARVLLGRAAVRQPWRPGPWAAHGVLLHRMGDDALAERMLRTAIALSPSTPHQHASLAEVYRSSGRAEAAFREARLAASLHPARAEYRELLSKILSELGQSREAARQAEWARRLDVLPDGGWLAPELPRGAALRETLPPPEPAS